MNEEIRGVTYDLGGAKLDPWQSIQRLYLAGFSDVKVLAIAYATMMGESGGYMKAWHHNVARTPDGDIVRDANGAFTVKSTDLGFIQKNIVHTPVMRVTDAESPLLAERLFEQHPELARGDESAKIAHDMFKQRGFQPWYAWVNGHFKRHLPAGCVAVGNFLGMALVGDKDLVKFKTS